MREWTLSSVAGSLLLVSIALLPWGRFPPFPWLHQNAQWSDAFFASAAAVWLADRCRRRRWPGSKRLHLVIAAYLAAAFFSFLFTAAELHVGGMKLLGTAELGVMAVVTSDLLRDTRLKHSLSLVLALTALAVAALSVLALLLFYLGIHTPLLAGYGEHLARSTAYARIRFFTSGPNLLGSYCVFASSVLGLGDPGIPPRLRRSAQAALTVTVLLTLSYEILAFALAASIRNAHSRPFRRALVPLASIFAVSALLLTVANPAINLTDPRGWELNLHQPSGRWHTAVTSLQTIKENPLWGSGPGSPPGRYRDYPYDAHMTLLNVAGTMGLPALVCFIGIFVVLWRGRRRPTNWSVWAPFAAFALSSLVCDVEDFRHLWVMIGIADADGEGK